MEFHGKLVKSAQVQLSHKPGGSFRNLVSLHFYFLDEINRDVGNDPTVILMTSKILQ